MVTTSPRVRLDAALDRVADTFRGMTTRPDEFNCECHWGSAEELARLKVPDLPLDPDLLDRAWRATDWTDHAAVLRRILPQLTVALVDGRAEAGAESGSSFDRGGWRRWPDGQAAAIWEFLDAWWAETLASHRPTVRPYEVLAFCTEASGTLGRWLDAWEGGDDHLAEAVAHWDTDLRYDDLPWRTMGDEAARRAELTAWLVRHAPARLSGRADLLDRVRLLGLDGPDRWDDPSWPDRG